MQYLPADPAEFDGFHVWLGLTPRLLRVGHFVVLIGIGFNGGRLVCTALGVVLVVVVVVVAVAVVVVVVVMLVVMVVVVVVGVVVVSINITL